MGPLVWASPPLVQDWQIQGSGENNEDWQDPQRPLDILILSRGRRRYHTLGKQEDTHSRAGIHPEGEER